MKTTRITHLSVLFTATVLAVGLLGVSHAFAAPDIEAWVGIPGTSISTNWSDTANWSGTSHNPNDNAVNFINNGPSVPGTVDNVVDTSTNCYSLSFTNTTTSHTTLIQPGQILTVDGTNGTGVSLVGNPLGQAQTTNSITGASGTLLITGVSAGSVFVASTNSAASNIAPLLDLSGLGTFILSNVSSASTIWVGNGANRSDGQLFLAKTNYLALPGTGTGNSAALTIGDNTSNNGSSPGGVLLLGLTNTILADNISVGLSKQNGATVKFNPAFTNGGANPVVYIRGFSGTAVKKWSIGDGLSQSGTSAASTGNVDFRNGTVNAIVSVLVMGRPSSTSVTAPNANGTLSLSAGSISVGILTNGWMTVVAGVGGTPTNQTANATINITGTATFSAANVFMANALGTGGTDSATFNVTNATLAVGTITLGGGNSTNNLNNGTFIVTNTVGTPANRLTALNLTGGTVQLNVNGSINVTNICATTVGTGGTTTIAIGSIANVTSTTTFPLISYTGTDPFGSLTLAALPNSFTGNLVDDTAKQTIDLSLTPPVAASPIVWVGATNATLVSNWDDTTTNWLDLATRSVPTAFMDLDPVQFDDTASNGVVTLLTNVQPFSILVTNNALNYTFNGAGKITGTANLIKDGPGSLTLAETGGDSFNSGIIVSNGTLVLDNAGSSISGGLNIVAGTAQLGNNDANGNLPGAVTDNGTLVFDRSDTLGISTAIAGSGSVTKTANNTLTLSGNNSFGGLLVNAGALRLSGATAQGAGTITVTNTGAVVLSQAFLNPIVLSGGTLGESASLNPLTNNLTATAGTTSLIYEADPQNLGAGDASEMAWSNTLAGAGSIIVASVTNDASADSGNGFRLRGTTATTFSGTITFSNAVKGELQTAVAGPFSPAGSGTIQLLCGTYLGNNSTSNSLPNTNGYTEFNLRNNGAGNTTLGNNVVILGSGFTTLDPLGSAPAGSSVTMGNLTVGGGQEVGVYLSAAPAHVIIFPTVTLTGGTARFSPKTPGFGTVASVGSDLTFGSVSETSPSSIVMNGQRTLTFTGNATYSGSTIISNGTLEVDGAILGTGAVTVESGATLDGTGLVAGPVTVPAGGTLSPGNTATPTATLAISNTLALSGTNIMDVNKTGGVFVNDVITNITTLTYGGILQLNLTGDPLAAGDAIKLYSCHAATSGFAQIVPTTPGTGLLWNTSTLSSGVLSVVSAVNTSPTNITTQISGNSLTLSWPADHIGWRLQVQTNALATGLYTNWTDVSGSTTVDSVNTTIDPANGAVFYRMVYP